MPSIGSYRLPCPNCSKLLSTIHRKPCTGVQAPELRFVPCDAAMCESGCALGPVDCLAGLVRTDRPVHIPTFPEPPRRSSQPVGPFTEGAP